MKYGLQNKKLQLFQQNKIIKILIDNNINLIETAHNYNNYFSLKKFINNKSKIITKIPKINKMVNYDDFLHYYIEQPRKLLNINYFYGVHLHDSSHLVERNGFIWKYLQETKYRNKIQNIGVSFIDCNDFNRYFNKYSFDFYQIPFNILDNRWFNHINLLKNSKSKIHVRSIYLKGLLTKANPDLFIRCGFTNGKEIVEWMNYIKSKYGFKNFYELCTSFIFSHNWINKLIIGFSNYKQLNNLLNLEIKILRKEELKYIDNTRPKIDSNSLNPINWKL